MTLEDPQADPVPPQGDPVGTIWGREPVAIVTVVMAVIAVLATYGLNVVPDPDKFSTALGLVLSLIAGGAVSRSQVSPA